MLGRSSGNYDWLLALAFLAVFVYATHATRAIAFEWKPGFSTDTVSVCFSYRKSVNTSQALNTGRASNTSRGSDLIV